MSSAYDQFLSVLRSTKHRIEYLNESDWMMILERSALMTFAKHQVLIQRGKQSKMVFLVLSGKVTIEGFSDKIAQIGPGEVIGEMAFLESSLPSATAVAEMDVEAFGIEWKALSELFDMHSDLASHFYRSVAVNLSRRLRELIKPR